MIKFNVEKIKWKSLDYNYDILCLDDVVKQKRLMNRVVSKIEYTNNHLSNFKNKKAERLVFELNDILYINFFVSSYFNKNLKAIIKEMLNNKEEFNKLIEQIIVEFLRKKRDALNNTIN